VTDEVIKAYIEQRRDDDSKDFKIDGEGEAHSFASVHRLEPMVYELQGQKPPALAGGVFTAF
jgi:hypothetical protein